MLIASRGEAAATSLKEIPSEDESIQVLDEPGLIPLDPEGPKYKGKWIPHF
jgi:hypothetical protein